ncbi:hypothetical protein [Micromonospora psammae]|uniref:hypothetical protein n=1 Tax=Micromonospora sp. CPCC 205556 TaxID=3122398 RepID=UPI002FF413F5
MHAHCYVGAADPDNPHLVRARVVLVNGYPGAVVPTLSRIWAGHAHRDTGALVTAMLAHDWEYLDDTITADTTCALPGQHPVVGVGMALSSTAASSIDAPEPVTVFPLCQAAHLDAVWVYLIDCETATVAVHGDDGAPFGRYDLDACAAPHPDGQPGRVAGTMRKSGGPRGVRYSLTGARG